jgi:hypothetical protein
MRPVLEINTKINKKTINIRRVIMSKKLSWLSIVAGVLSILAGFYLMANPALSLLSFAILFALIFMVNGISDIIKYFSADEKSGWDLFTGVMTVL